MNLSRVKKSSISFCKAINWRRILKYTADIAIPVVMGIICYYLFSYIGLVYETNDDPASILLLSNEGEFFTPLFSKPLSTFVATLTVQYTEVAVWTYITLITIAVSLTVCLYILRVRLKPILFWPTSIFVILIFALTSVENINFTRTAATAAVAGVMLILQGIIIFNRRGWFAKLLSVMAVILGTTIWFWGAMIRDQVAYLILPFAGIFVLFYILSQTEKLNFKQFFRNLRTPMIIAIAALLAAFIATYFSYNMFTAQERESLEYYKARIAVQDYKDNYPSYDEAKDEYKALGITENEYHMIFDSWTTEDTNYFTTELFLEMRETLYEQNSISEAIDIAIEFIMSYDDIFYLTLIFIMIMIVFATGLQRLYLFSFIVSAFAYTVFLAIQGRILERAVDPVFLYILLMTAMLSGTKTIKNNRNCWVTKPKAASLVMSIIIVFSVYPIFTELFSEFSNNVKNIDIIKSDWSSQAGSDDFNNHLKENSETAYILTLSDGITFMLSSNTSATVPLNIDDAYNLFFLGGWDARTPSNYSRLEEYGIYNPMEAILEDDKAVTIYSEMLHNYLTEHYGEDIAVSMVDTLYFANGGTVNFFTFSKAIDEVIPPIDLENISKNEIELSQFFYAVLGEGYINVPTHDTFCIKGQLTDEQINRYNELYLNVERVDGRTSYKMHLEEDGSFLSYAFGLDGDILEDTIELSLVARTDDGELIKTQILTNIYLNEEMESENDEV